MENRFVIYADGACNVQSGIGGWAATLTIDKTVKTISGSEVNTTNNRMELLAVINALSILKCEGSCPVIYSDSKYVVEGITKWIRKWELNGWKTATKNPLLNVDLWKRLKMLVGLHNPVFIWVKGHADSEGNNNVDQLANRRMNERCLYNRPNDETTLTDQGEELCCDNEDATFQDQFDERLSIYINQFNSTCERSGEFENKEDLCLPNVL